MRLLITTDTVGGVWTYTTKLTRALLQNGAAVALVTIGRRPTSTQQSWLDETSAEWRTRFRWDVSEAALEWMNNNDGAYCEVAPLLLQVAREFQPDLLHSNQFCFGALPLSMPRLVVAHSDVLSWAASCRGKALESSAWLDRYICLVSTGLRDASAVVAPTRWMLDALHSHFDFNCEAQVISNGRTLEAKAHQPERKLQAVTAGRLWDEAKNLRVLHNLQAPFPILLVGDTEYESQTAAALPAYVDLVGHLAEDELLELFQESAIYLCTSVYEPFGLAPLEAALCGCAVVAKDIPSLREVWGDGAVYFQNTASLQAILIGLARDPRQLAAARHRSWLVAQRYSAANTVSSYLKLYEAMLTKFERRAHVA